MNSDRDIAASDGSGSMKAYLAMPAGKPKAGIVAFRKSWRQQGHPRHDRRRRRTATRRSPGLFWRPKPGAELDADILGRVRAGLDLLQKIDATRRRGLAASIAALRSRGCARSACRRLPGGRLAFRRCRHRQRCRRSADYGVGLDNLRANDRTSSKSLLLHIVTRDNSRHRGPGQGPRCAEVQIRRQIDEYDADPRLCAWQRQRAAVSAGAAGRRRNGKRFWRKLDEAGPRSRDMHIQRVRLLHQRWSSSIRMMTQVTARDTGRPRGPIATLRIGMGTGPRIVMVLHVPANRDLNLFIAFLKRAPMRCATASSLSHCLTADLATEAVASAGGRNNGSEASTSSRRNWKWTSSSGDDVRCRYCGS